MSVIEIGGRSARLRVGAAAGFFLAAIASLAVVFGALPAAAQLWPNDVRLTPWVDATYNIAPEWKLNFYGEVRLDRNVSRSADAILRPNIQYAFSPQWSVAAGFVQFQPVQATFLPERGPFQDLFYLTSFGDLGVLNRLRFNETFAYQQAAMLGSTSYFLSLQYPLGESSWFAVLSNETYFNLKVDGTGRQAGFSENKTNVGVGRTIDRHLTLVGTYELSAINVGGVALPAHTFKFGLVFALN
jgi:hypothetical protein